MYFSINFLNIFQNFPVTDPLNMTRTFPPPPALRVHGWIPMVQISKLSIALLLTVCPQFLCDVQAWFFTKLLTISQQNLPPCWGWIWMIPISQACIMLFTSITFSSRFPQFCRLLCHCCSFIQILRTGHNLPHPYPPPPCTKIYPGTSLASTTYNTALPDFLVLSPAKCHLEWWGWRLHFNSTLAALQFSPVLAIIFFLTNYSSIAQFYSHALEPSLSSIFEFILCVAFWCVYHSGTFLIFSYF